MENNILDSLNPFQRQACEEFKGPSMVVAGAGSGKTRVITYRIANMINCGVKPYHIITLTFTNKAAKEMRSRIESVVGNEQAKQIWMGTYHSLFSRILRTEAEHLGFDKNFTIYDTSDSKRLIRNSIKELNLDDSVYNVNKIMSRISNAKNNLLTAKSYQNNEAVLKADFHAKVPLTGVIYEDYARKCAQSDAMDFDDLLLYTNILFRDNPDVLAKYQNKFKYILVDEYQDTNLSQYLIIKKLADMYKNICVVGDDAQSIYSFRGARIENILNFKRDYPNFKSFKLEQNYRSSQTIVDAASSLIKKNKEQIKKNVFSENAEGNKIKLIEAQTDTFEGYEVVSNIKTLIAKGGYKYEDFAILYRTNNQSRIFEEVLRKYTLPYKIYSGLSFYQLAEIKNLLAYLRLAVNSKDADALRRIINYPKRGIGATSVDKINSYASENNINILDLCYGINVHNVGLNSGTRAKINAFSALIQDVTDKANNLNAFDAALEIYKVTGMKHQLDDDSVLENQQRRKNVEELLNGIREFMEQFTEEEEPSLQEYLQNVALLTDAEAASGDENDKIKLMTVHASKGLEFKNVYIVGLEEKLFPSSMVVTEKDIEEERRLMYVAITRAEENLTLSYANERFRFGTREATQQSRFLKEIDEQYFEQTILNKPRFSTHSSAYSSSENDDSGRMFKKKTKIKFNSSNSYMKENSFKKLRKLESNENPGTFNARICAGSKVKHGTFGVGIVEELVGEEANKKVTVLFNNGNRKTLLLKFAKLDFLG
jgi:DNA helicase-2/ATP-dependent DNA helicase PcrA